MIRDAFLREEHASSKVLFYELEQKHFSIPKRDFGGFRVGNSQITSLQRGQQNVHLLEQNTDHQYCKAKVIRDHQTLKPHRGSCGLP